MTTATMPRPRISTDAFDRLDVGYYSQHDVELTLDMAGMLTARCGSTDIVRFTDGRRRIVCAFDDDTLASKTLIG